MALDERNFSLPFPHAELVDPPPKWKESFPMHFRPEHHCADKGVRARFAPKFSITRDKLFECFVRYGHKPINPHTLDSCRATKERERGYLVK